jgi:hypothetical protein
VGKAKVDLQVPGSGGLLRGSDIEAARRHPSFRSLPTGQKCRARGTFDRVSTFTLDAISSPVLCSSNSHLTGTSAGASLSLIKTTGNFAGLVLLAFRSTT